MAIRLHATLAIAGVLGLAIPGTVALAAGTTEVADQPSTQFSGPTVGGTSSLAGATVTITLPDGTTRTTTTSNQGRWRYVLPKGTRGRVTVTIIKGTESEEGAANVASLGAPQGNEGRTVATVSAGSTATLGATTFSLSGGFTALDTSADYNPASPTYGRISGYVPASLLHINGSDAHGNTLTLSLSSNPTFSLNLESVWNYIDANGTVTGQTASIALSSLSGIADYDGIPISFTGTATGTETFNDPGFDSNPAIGLDPAIDDYTFSFDLTLASGQTITGTINATGPEYLVPESASFPFLAVGSALLMGFAQRTSSRGSRWLRRSSPQLVSRYQRI